MKNMLILSAALFLGGCLSVVRIPMCHEKVSDEGEVTNRVWSSFCDDVPGMRVYPTVKMRCRVTAEWWKPIPPEAKGKRLREIRMLKHWGWIPLCVIWLTAPFDAAIDTAFLPWDLYVRGEKDAKGRSVTATDTGKPYECAATNEYDNIYSLVWDEGRIRRAAEFYQNLEKKAIENPYADETVELSPYCLFPDGGKLIDEFDAKYRGVMVSAEELTGLKEENRNFRDEIERIKRQFTRVGDKKVNIKDCILVSPDGNKYRWHDTWIIPQWREVIYIDGKPYKVERMKEDERAYVQPEIVTDAYIK